MKPKTFASLAVIVFSLETHAFASIAVTNGTFGTTNRNAQYVDGGGWFESTTTTNWVEGSWASGGAPTFPSGSGMACLFDGAAANGYIYQKIGTIDAADIANGTVQITCDFAEKSDDITVDGTFDVYAGTFTGAHGTDIAGGGLTNIFTRTMTAADQGLTAASGNASRQSARFVGDVNISGLTAGTDLWLRIGRPSSGSGDLLIDNVAAGLLVPTLFWDTSGTTAGAGGSSPAGTWDGSTPNWTSSSAGTSGTTTWTTGGAVFAAGSDATGAYTVTVSGSQQAQFLNAEEGTVTLNGGQINLITPATVATSTGSQLLIQSPITGVNGVSISGTGATTLSANNTYTGPTSLAGAVTLSGGSAVPDASAVTSVSGSTITLQANETIGDLSGAGTFALGANALTLGGTANTSFTGTFGGAGGSLVKQGTGTLALTATSSLTGPVAVNGGTLGAAGPGADGVFPNISSLTINNGGTVASGSNGLFGYNNHPVPVTVNAGGTLTVNGGGSGGPNIFGTITLAGGTVAEDNSIHSLYGSYNFGGASITATGTTTSLLSARDFQLRNTSTTVQVDSGSTLNVTGYFTGLAHASGKSISKTGAGTLILASTVANSHGPTNVNGGTLRLTGLHGTGKITVASGATLAGTGTTAGVVEVQAGGFLTMEDTSINQLTLNSSVSLAGTTTLEITKDGGTPAADKVFVGSSVTYGGTLNVSNITADSSPLSVGDSFVLFDALSYTGGFTTFNLPALPEGLSWDRSGLTANGTITVIDNVSTPVFSPPAGGYAGAQNVTITSDSGSTIYYTLDGSNPGPSSPSGSSPVTGITIPTDSTRTIKAYAVKAGQGNSAVATADYTTVSTPTWTEPLGGYWVDSDGFNWLGGVVANGSQVTADFNTLTLQADTTVTLSSARTIGHLVFGDVGNAFQWTLDGSELTLAGVTPSITVQNQRTVISAPLDGVSGLVKLGSGTLRLAANEGYSGNTVVNGGTLELAAGGAAYTNSTLQGTITVNSGATCSLASATALGWGGGVTDIYLNGGTLSGSGAQAVGVSYHLTGGTINSTGAIRLGVLTGFPNVTLTSSASATTSVIDAGSLDLNTTFGQTSLAVAVAQGTTPSGVDLQINAPIGGGQALVKSGAGNLLLAGANTYGGATTVNQGTLTINGSNTSAITVNGTSILAGTGNAAGSATIAATAFVAPGGSAAGELHTGAATVNGTYSCQIDGNTCDRLTVTGSLTFGSGATIAISTLPGGATQSSYVIASHTGALNGTPQVTGIPAGYSLDLATPNQIRIVKPSGYSTWASANANGQTMDLDYDADGVSNGIEYFMGETGSGNTVLPAPDANRLVTWIKAPAYTGAYGTDYRIEISADLGLTDPWTTVPEASLTIGAGSVSYDLDTAPAGAKKFARLVVTGP